MNTNMYDVSLLKIKPNKTDRAQFIQAHPKYAKDLRIFTILIGIFIVAILLVLYFLVASLIANPEDFVPGLMTLLFFMFTLAMCIFGISFLRQRTDKLIRLNNFAMAHDMQLVFDVPMKEPYAGLIFDNGHSGKIKETLRSKSKDMEFGTYVYVTGSGKSQTTHTFGYARVKLDRHVPNLLLDARKNNTFISSNLPDTYAKSQKLSLEGNFDTHFTLYAPVEYKTDALYIFTPDVMASLIDHGTDFDIELVDDYLYLYRSTDPLRSPEMIRSWLDVIGTIEAQIGKQARGYEDSRAATGVESLGMSVGSEGRRLKKGLSVAGIVSIAFMIGIAILPFVSDLRINFGILFASFCFLATILIALLAFKGNSFK